MLKLYDGEIYLKDGREIFTSIEEASKACGRELSRGECSNGTIAWSILHAHDKGGDEQTLRMMFDSLTSHDITYVGIIQTARASGMESFPMPYVLTNCHNSLCAVGGTINEDDHAFALSAAKKYGGIYVPANMAVIHSYNREMMAGCGRMILGSDSHTRYGAVGTLAVGEGGGELAKQLVGRTYDIARPEVIAIYLTGEPHPGVGPQDVALALVEATFKNGYVKNRVMEFVGPGIAKLPMEFRNGIDVMTTETTCWSSIWETDGATEEYLASHGRADAYRRLAPAQVARYDGCIYVELDKIEPMIALPMHPSNAMPIRELNASPLDIIRECEATVNSRIVGAKIDLVSKVRDGGVWADQAIAAGCSGGTFDNIAAMADILRGKNCGNGTFRLSVYPGSMPTYAEMMRNGCLNDLVSAGAVIRECFCGPCFGAGDTPANGELSIRHSTRNFPNREGSKPGEGQMSAVALMDARSIAATAVNGGRITPATEIEVRYTHPKYAFDKKIYETRVYDGTGHPHPEEQLKMGPNIKDWPKMPEMSDDIMLKVVSYITDPVTTTDELIPSGETSSFRSDPHRLSEFALSRKDPGYVGRAKAVRAIEQGREEGKPVSDDVVRAYDAVSKYMAAHGAQHKIDAAGTVIGSTIFANCPGDGSAREQAASCQRVLGGAANIALEYATKRYRSNCVNWGMVPFITETPDAFALGSWVFVPGAKAAVLEGRPEIKAYVVSEAGGVSETTLKIGALTDEERQTIADGCLINYYKKDLTKGRA